VTSSHKEKVEKRTRKAKRDSLRNTHHTRGTEAVGIKEERGKRERERERGDIRGRNRKETKMALNIYITVYFFT